MSERVTIHITSRDRSSELAIVLHSLLYQTYKAFDVIILDNAYGTPIAGNFKFIHDVIGRLKIRGHGVGLLRDNVSYGVCKARQRLIDEDMFSDNPLILRLDDDESLEPDFIERLVKVMNEHSDAGLVSGVTPNLSGPDFVKKAEFENNVINEVRLDAEGNIVHYADDCGILYDKSVVLRAHNFRSNALMKREMFTKGLSYPRGKSLSGFREEAHLSFDAILMGYSIWIDTGAIAYHAHALSGGCRAPDYIQRVQMDERSWQEYVKTKFKKHGDFLKIYNEKVFKL